MPTGLLWTSIVARSFALISMEEDPPIVGERWSTLRKSEDFSALFVRSTNPCIFTVYSPVYRGQSSISDRSGGGMGVG